MSAAAMILFQQHHPAQPCIRYQYLHHITVLGINFSLNVKRLIFSLFLILLAAKVQQADYVSGWKSGGWFSGGKMLHFHLKFCIFVGLP